MKPLYAERRPQSRLRAVVCLLVPRFVLAAILSLMLLGFSAYSVITTWVFPSDAPLKAQCDAWLERPAQRWVALRGCLLDADLVIVESEAGDFEKLSYRRQGLSMKPYPVPPNWVAAWIPVRSAGSAAGVVRAAYRLESKDMLKWINTLERADEREKERMWADPAPILRMTRPGVLAGHAQKPPHEGLQKAFGTGASGNLLAIIAGEPPPPTAPAAGILAGLLGLVALGYFFRLRLAPVEELSAAQQITGVNVSDVKLEIGALEEIRKEERGRRNRKIE